MNGTRFHLAPSHIMPSSDLTIISDGDDPIETLVNTVHQDIGTDVLVTVGETTMFLAAWEDPDHWGEEWREQGAEPGEEREYVLGLLAAANEDWHQ